MLISPTLSVLLDFPILNFGIGANTRRHGVVRAFYAMSFNRCLEKETNIMAEVSNIKIKFSDVFTDNMRVLFYAKIAPISGATKQHDFRGKISRH